jgi:hypothetical protein
MIRRPYGIKKEGRGRTYRVAMFRMQAEELYYEKEPPQHSGKAGNE